MSAAPSAPAAKPPVDLVNVQIDGTWHQFPKGTRMIEACRQVGSPWFRITATTRS